MQSFWESIQYHTTQYRNTQVPRNFLRPWLKPAHLLEGEGRFIPILVTEVIIHPKVRLSAKLVSGFTVWDAFNHTTLRKRRSANKNVTMKLKFTFYNLKDKVLFSFDQLNTFTIVTVEMWGQQWCAVNCQNSPMIKQVYTCYQFNLSKYLWKLTLLPKLSNINQHCVAKTTSRSKLCVTVQQAVLTFKRFHLNIHAYILGN